MKVLIWVVCIFVNALVTTIVKESGVILGAIPTVILYGVTIWLARTLCKKWDEHKAAKLPTPSSNIDPKTEEVAENKIRYCRKCGAKLLEDSMFCDKCGTKVITQFEQSPVSQETTTPSANQKKGTPSVSSPQQRAEAEYLRQAQIRQERNFALAKRVAATEVANKKKRIIKIIIISIIVVAIFIGIICAAVDSAHNNELRNFATETMKDEYNNVYADVVSIEPEYFVYTSNGSTYREITEVVCRCKTVEGKTIWVVFFSWKYPGGSANNEDAYETLTYSKSNPARISGYVTTSGSVIKQLENSIGDVFVLRVEKMEK